MERALDELPTKDWTKKPVRKGEGTRWFEPKTGRSFIVERQVRSKDPLHQGWYLRVSMNGKVTRIPLEGNPVLSN